jgi:hypothetical protein
LIIKQFNIMLYCHSLFYIAELTLTSIWSEFTNGAIHHLFALYIFYIMLEEHGMVCCTSILPFLLHHISWIEGAENQLLLKIYNITFLVCGIIGFNVLMRSRSKYVSYRLPILCIAEVSVNLFTHCWDYGDFFCPNGYVLPRIIETGMFSMGVVSLVSISALKLVSFQKKWKKIIKIRKRLYIN